MDCNNSEISPNRCHAKYAAAGPTVPGTQAAKAVRGSGALEKMTANRPRPGGFNTLTAERTTLSFGISG